MYIKRYFMKRSDGKTNTSEPIKEPKHPSVVVSVIRVAHRTTEGCFCNHINCFLAISDTKSISSLAGSTNGSTSVSRSRI